MGEVKLAESVAIGILQPNDRKWVPVPALGGGEVKMLNLDEENHRVAFLYRFEKNAVLPRHSHKCAAQAITLEGEWEYEEGALPVGAYAYEPVGSTHAPKSKNGAVLFITLMGDSDEFLTWHYDDGSEMAVDMDVFRSLDAECRV